MKKILIIMVVVLLVIVAFGLLFFNQKTLGSNVLDVSVEYFAPFSTSSIYIEGTVPDKFLTYTGVSQEMNIDEKETKKISDEEFDAVADLVRENDFWSFEQEYRDENLVDETAYVVSVTSVPYGCYRCDAVIRKVGCYGVCPEEITNIRKSLEELWGGSILQIGV
jgi:hypothetical protein